MDGNFSFCDHCGGRHDNDDCPTRQAYSREEITNKMNLWMVSQFGPLEDYKNEPEHRDKWLRDNGLLNRFIRDHFPSP
jgi:hypothetical protein